MRGMREMRGVWGVRGVQGMREMRGRGGGGGRGGTGAGARAKASHVLGVPLGIVPLVICRLRSRGWATSIASQGTRYKGIPQREKRQAHLLPPSSVLYGFVLYLRLMINHACGSHTCPG
jgi:hypothetical protein